MMEILDFKDKVAASGNSCSRISAQKSRRARNKKRHIPLYLKKYDPASDKKKASLPPFKDFFIDPLTKIAKKAVNFKNTKDAASDDRAIKQRDVSGISGKNPRFDLKKSLKRCAGFPVVITASALIFGLISLTSLSSSVSFKYDDIAIHSDNSVDELLAASILPMIEEDIVNIEDADDKRLISLDITDYKVKKGDTLSEISQKYNVNLGTLISFNKITNVRRLTAGTVLKIPDKNGIFYKINKGDSLEKIAGKFNISFNELLDANNIITGVIQPGEALFIPNAKMDPFELKKAMGELFLWPVQGILTSYFGARKDPITGKASHHYGIDIANAKNTPIKASLGGKVSICGTSYLYGKYVIINHANNYQTLYAHLNGIKVKKGEYVNQSQTVGYMGTTGRSTGVHLHFSIYKNNKPINPLLMLPKKQG